MRVVCGLLEDSLRFCFLTGGVVCGVFWVTDGPAPPLPKHRPDTALTHHSQFLISWRGRGGAHLLLVLILVEAMVTISWAERRGVQVPHQWDPGIMVHLWH